MLVEWGVLAAKTAASCAVSLPASHAYRTKIEPLFKKGDLAHELSRAYEAAFKAFVDVLRLSLEIDDVLDARLREMFGDDGFQELLGRLPHVRFEALDVGRARDLFLGLGLPGASAAYFEVAWASLGKRFRDQVAQTTHAAKLVELAQNDRIVDYLARLVDLAERRQSAVRDESAALAAYRRYVDDLYRLADTRGLFWREKETVGEEIRLADVFVETLLRRRDSRLRLPPDREDDATTEDAEEARQRPVEVEQREDPRSVAEVLAAERRLVILGPPGSGKSTLVRCLALALAADGDQRPLDPGLPESTVPLLLPLKTYAARLKNDGTFKLDAFLRDELAGHLPDLDEILENGRALVLLDGLDEVFDEAHRRWVSDEVWRLMSRFGTTRFVLTSRPHGYRAAPLPGPVPLFDVEPFDDGRIGRFFRGWFTALASQGLEVDRERSPEQRAEDLTREVLARPRIRDLAENPMLSTLIVLVHRSRSGRLPERRVKFYEAAVAVLAEHWERAKHSPKQEEAVDFPAPETLIDVLAEVAWRAQTELGGREIPSDLLEGWLLEALAQDPEWTAKRRRAVSDFLKVVQERTGLLVDAGGGRRQFVHLSLQEYLVALYLLERLDERQVCRVVRHFLHAPEWEEILRLAIGAAPRARAEAIVRAILDEPSSEWESQILRDLRFVCRCLEDRPNVGEAARGDVERRWSEALDRQETLDQPGLIVDGTGPGLTAAMRDASAARLADEDWRARSAAVEYFARIGADDQATRHAVAARLADDNWRVRSAAVEYFARIGADDQATRDAFAARLAHDDGSVQSAAVEYFARIGADDQATRHAVAARLAHDDWSVRRVAVAYFARIGADDQATRHAVAARLADDDGSVRSAAVEYFARIGADDQATRHAVAARLADDDGRVQRAAVEYFARIGADDQATRDAFAARLAHDDGRVRRAAVEYLACIGADDQTTRDAVAARLADDDGRVRRAAVAYFARIGADDQATRDAFAVRLADDDWIVRRAAVMYFVRRGIQAQEAMNVLAALSVTRLWVPPDDLRSFANQIGRLATTDDALRQRIIGDRIPEFDLAVALRAAAARRDELRRESTSLSDVLAGRISIAAPESPSEAR